MLKTAYIIHGVCDAEEYFEMDFPSPSNAHFFPWLQQKFLRSGVLCQCLEMPTPPTATYALWKATFQQAQLNSTSIIVGHSAGCGFILKWLAENPKIHINKLLLVAPWLDPFGEYKDFLEGHLDLTLSDRINEIDILYSDDDTVEGVKESKNKIMQAYPKAKLHAFKDKGHFCLGDVGKEFHEIWNIIQS